MVLATSSITTTGTGDTDTIAVIPYATNTESQSPLLRGTSSIVDTDMDGHTSYSSGTGQHCWVLAFDHELIGVKLNDLNQNPNDVV